MKRYKISPHEDKRYDLLCEWILSALKLILSHRMAFLDIWYDKSLPLLHRLAVLDSQSDEQISAEYALGYTSRVSLLIYDIC